LIYHFFPVDDGQMDTLLSIRIFCEVAELKSFTSAAQKMNLSLAMVSKHVLNLEKRLSTRLLNRSSRHVSLTEAGDFYLKQALVSLEGLDEAEVKLGDVASRATGTLRVSAPVWAASAPFVSMIKEFRTRFPDVRVDLDLSARVVNLVEEGFDVALRATTTLDGDIIARPVVEIPFYLVCSPDFLGIEPLPVDLKDVTGREFLAYTPILVDNTIPLRSRAKWERVRVEPVLQSRNETVLHLAAQQGMGFALLPEWLVRQDIANGRLVRALPDYEASVQLFAVYPSRKHLSAKVRAFIDFMVQATASV
jgi:DNA-binding transcriptional LysR family regulator